jgi:hypothetical protein
MLYLFGLIAVFLTSAMFLSKQSMLGFPAAIFWALLGGQAYIMHVTTWDIYFLLAFASLLGMVTFTIYAAYGLREKPDYYDQEADVPDNGRQSVQTDTEDGEPAEDKTSDGFYGETEPNKRTVALRARATDRRTGKPQKRKMPWGQFR